VAKRLKGEPQLTTLDPSVQLDKRTAPVPEGRGAVGSFVCMAHIRRSTTDLNSERRDIAKFDWFNALMISDLMGRSPKGVGPIWMK